MRITTVPNGHLQIDGARITHKNFTGVKTMYNAEGNRNFSLIIEDEETANQLKEQGWNIKIKLPEEEGDVPFMYMPVKVLVNEYGPSVYIQSGAALNKIDSSEIGRLDKIRIASVDVDIRPFDWTMPNGTSGRSAYLQGIVAVQRVDRFAERFNNWNAENDM